MPATPTTRIPADRKIRNPLITAAAYRHLRDIIQHPHAPSWNYTVGDRVRREDLPEVDAFRKTIATNREPAKGRPPPWCVEWVRSMTARVQIFKTNIRPGTNIERDWACIPTMSRRDIAVRPECIVPADVDLDRLIVYDTSGVTGHAIYVPHHPRAVAQNHPLIEFVLAQHGCRPAFSAGEVACINVGAQLNTVVFANVFSVWNQAGFAKVNLHPHRWSREHAREFMCEMNPLFLTGDPIGFAELMRWEIPVRPRAMISTAVALAPAARDTLAAHFQCPVIDLYSTTETGPVAYAPPGGAGLQLLPPDLYVEFVDAEGFPVPEGERGEICVTGGRNPYLPLLRYRTGDFARLAWSAKAGSHDVTPVLLDFEARDAVVFVASDGTAISPVDVGREIRAWPFVQHELVQRADLSCRLVMRPMPDQKIDPVGVREKMEQLFGNGIAVEVVIDEHLGDDRPGGKVVPFRSEAVLRV